MPNKYFSIDGVATYVHHQGATTLPEVPPDLGRGEPILCLHGGGGNGAVFEALSRRLAVEHSPIAFDQPGHGRSGGLDSLGEIERMADFARAFGAKLGLPPRVLLGHSMGGAIALELALSGAEDIRALVLVGSAARFPISDEMLQQSRLVTEGKQRRQFSREFYSPDAAPEVMKHGFMEDLKTDPRVGHGDLVACAEFDVSSRLGEIEIPVLVVRGDAEHAALEEQSALLARAIPGARSVVIPKAGHMLPIEQPEALADAILAFLAEATS